MNYLKAGLKVKLGLTNPYEIRPQYKLFSSPQSNSAKVKLVDKNIMNKQYHIMRFQLPEQNKCLGIKIGQYIWLHMGNQKRPYVPISPIDQPNHFDLLIRDMTKKNTGSFTEKLVQLPINTQITMTGPGTQFIYQGFGKFKYTDSLTKQNKQHKYKNIGIITHASAITTSFSLIQSIAINYDSNTGVSLLWIGDNSHDFVFLDQFVAFAEQSKLNLNLMLTQFEKGWVGPYGKVMEQHIADFMPPPGSNQLIIMSGLEGILADVPNTVKNMGYKNYFNF